METAFCIEAKIQARYTGEKDGKVVLGREWRLRRRRCGGQGIWARDLMKKASEM